MQTPEQTLDWIITAVECGTAVDAAITATGATPTQVADWLRDLPVHSDRLATAADRWRARRSAEPTGPARKALNRWRLGERGTATRNAHNNELRAWRRELAAAQLPPGLQRRLLTDLAAGTPLTTAVSTYGLSVQAVFGRAQWDHDWRARLDKALTAGRRPDIEHPSLRSYREFGCRCPDCRKAKHADRGSRR